MFMKSQWEEEPLNKHLTLFKVNPRWKAWTLTSILLPRLLLRNSSEMLHSIGINIPEASITHRKLKLPRLNSTLVVNLQEQETFTIGKWKLLIAQCLSVTNCFHWANFWKESLILNSMELWQLPNLRRLYQRSVTDFTVAHQPLISPNPHQLTFPLTRLRCMATATAKPLTNSWTQLPWNSAESISDQAHKSITCNYSSATESLNTLPQQSAVWEVGKPSGQFLKANTSIR